MKMLLVLVSSLLLSFAHASEIKIFELPEAMISGTRISYNFAVDKESHKAWVELRSQHFSPAAAQVFKVKVPGLSYQGGAIMIDHEGQLVDCASVEKGRFGQTLIKSTGRCKFRGETVNAEDEYSSRIIRRYDSYLIVK